MRNYEVTVILQPQLEDDDRDEVVGQVTELLAPGAEEADKPVLDVWGMRKMAYEIQKFKQGYYLHYNASLDSTRIPEIERRLQYMEDVLRYLVVRKND